ncbi:MAG: Pycsar system effector family protein [Dyadobacter sp.]
MEGSVDEHFIRVAAPEIAKIRKHKTDRPNKGIETMFRISSSNHQRLSDMADNKAHIMITTTSIIMSVLLSTLIRRLEDNTHLITPTMLLLTVCMITMIFSILSTRPIIPHGTFTQDEIETKNVNLLFFGNFYRMSYDDYSAAMQCMMNDRQFLYGSLTKDVYSQGIVLGRKYRLLRIAYNVFMFGIIASVISFVFASF